jgi:hypothetical protein
MVRIASFEGIRSNRHSNFERYLAADALPRKKHIDAMPARGLHASFATPSFTPQSFSFR